MKTLVLYGSPKANGNTKHLLDALLSELHGEVKIVDCYHVNIAPCIDCGYCHKKRGCSIKDDMIPLYDYIDICDAVVIATPMHFGAVSAPMYTLFTRLQSYWSNIFVRKNKEERPKKKYGALLVTSGHRWMNMELLIEGVTRFAFEHIETECIGTAYAKKTDKLPAEENKTALKKARQLAQMLNELCENS